MKMHEMNQMSRKEIEQTLLDSYEEYQNLRFQHAMRQLDNPTRLRLVRRDIARFKTLLKEMDLGSRADGPKKI